MKPSREIVDLGRALVDQLGLAERHDMAACWMAHDIAAKIHAADACPDDTSAQAICAEAILKLWEHRAVYPHAKRPYESLEPILATLERLDPGSETPFYFRPKVELEGEAAEWLQRALDIDAVARVLIGYALGVAAAKNGEEGADWSVLAEASELEAPDVRIRRIIFTKIGVASQTVEEQERERLQSLIRSIARFQKSARAVAAQLKSDLASIGSNPR